MTEQCSNFFKQQCVSRFGSILAMSFVIACEKSLSSGLVVCSDMPGTKSRFSLYSCFLRIHLQGCIQHSSFESHYRFQNDQYAARLCLH